MAVRALSLAAPLLLVAPVRATTAPPSGLGDQSVFWIAVSPAYARTGLVLAVTTPQAGSCSGSCTELWASHDGGATWARSPASGWQQGRPVVVLDGGGREVLFAAAGGGMQRSDDEGASWRSAGGPGVLPAPDPNFASTGQVAVASGGGRGDYLLRGADSRPVAGSGGAMTDLQFALSPAYPGGGLFAPALLAGADLSTGLPVIQRCTAALACSGATTLSGATANSSPVTLLPAGDYPQSGAVFAQSGRGVYKSVDGGGSFAPLPVVAGASTATTATPSVALAPGYAERGSVRTLYASVFALAADAAHPHTTGGVYRSDDGGATWRDTGSPSALDMGSTAVAVAPDGRVFAGYLGSSSAGDFGGLLCSTDGGGTWQASCPAVVTRAGGGSSGGAEGGGGGAAGGSAAAAATGGAAAGAGGAGTPCAAGNRTCPGGPGSGAAGGVPGLAAAGSRAVGGTSHGGRAAVVVIAAVLAALLATAAAARALWRRRVSGGASPGA